MAAQFCRTVSREIRTVKARHEIFVVVWYGLMSSIVDEVFGPDGLLSKKFTGYEPRTQQITLAKAIEKAIEDEKHLLGEGPCGTGKSAAYIVPVTHAVKSGKKVVIATANIALQEQLFKKDLPTMQDILPWKFSYALIKGMNNYLCQYKYAKANLSPADMMDKDTRADWMAINEWAEETDTGDSSELKFIPSPKVWLSVSTSADECLKGDCPSAQSCFALRSRRAAMDADVIVTNYHALFADFALRKESGRGYLPDYDILVMDEAHEAADIARDFFGAQINNKNLDHLAAVVKSALKSESLAARLRREAEVFFNFVIDHRRSPTYKTRIRTKNFVDATGLEAVLRQISTESALQLDDESNKERKATLTQIKSRSENAADFLLVVSSLDDKNQVYWIDVNDNGKVQISSKCIYANQMIGDMLFASPTIKSVVAVSATMTTGNPHAAGAFDFVATELGAPKDVMLCAVDSPFDFGKQALVVIPEGIPSPKDKSWVNHVAKHTLAAITQAGGKTLALFTSYKSLNTTYDAVKYCGYQVLKQGQMPRTELTRIFREDVDSVLLGTESFWTGVDVQGESLSCLVIDKLPFASIDDPVADAIQERDSNSFMTYMVPRAVIMFRQGFGRLIRTQKDYGAIVILDNRIVDTNWGKGKFWSTLPKNINARRRVEDIGPFLAWAKNQLGS